MTWRHAFSLIELVLVIAIIGVMSALAAPRYAAAVHRYRAEAAARRIAADIGFAQSLARSSGQSRSIAFNVAADQYVLPDERDLDRAGSYTVDLSAAPYNASIATANFGGAATLTFNGFGMPASAGTVSILSGNTARIVTVNAETGAASWK